MSYPPRSTSSLQSTKRIGRGGGRGRGAIRGEISRGKGRGATRGEIGRGKGRGAIRGKLQRQSPHTAFIHILDDDSLLNVFHQYRPFLLGEDAADGTRISGGAHWVRGRWWYKLAHVCQLWRKIILGSSSYLKISLVCVNGTSVPDMLANSPPLPLDLDYYCDGHYDFTEKDEKGIILALGQRDRVRRVRFFLPAAKLQKVIGVIDEEYPILEHLLIFPRPEEDDSEDHPFSFPDTFHAPHLHHLALGGFAPPIGSPLLTTAAGLVTLYLHTPTFFYPNALLQCLSFIPQLEALVVAFSSPIPNRDVKKQLSRIPTIPHVTLSNLSWLSLHVVSAYLEAIVCRITTPRLRKLNISFPNQLIFPVPRLMQFMGTTENLMFEQDFESAKLKFSDDRVFLEAYRRGEAKVYALCLSVNSWHLDWQVSFMAQISGSLGQMFAAVKHLSLEHEEHYLSSEEHDEVDRTEWRRLLSSFINVTTLYIDDGLVNELSHCLRPDDGELPLEILPKLLELTYSGSGDTDNLFTSFIDARQNAGRSTNLVRRIAQAQSQ